MDVKKPPQSVRTDHGLFSIHTVRDAAVEIAEGGAGIGKGDLQFLQSVIPLQSSDEEGIDP